MRGSTGLRTIALFEAAKGALVLVVGFGSFALLHHDVQAAAEALVRHFHLNPAHRYPRIFLQTASSLTDARLWLLAIAATGYAAARFVEAYGLWHERGWARWLATISGGIYLPIEIYELAHRVSWPKLIVLLTNAAIVVYMLRGLVRRSRASEPRAGLRAH